MQPDPESVDAQFRWRGAAAIEGRIMFLGRSSFRDDARRRFLRKVSMKTGTGDVTIEGPVCACVCVHWRNLEICVCRKDNHKAVACERKLVCERVNGLFVHGTVGH